MKQHLIYILGEIIFQILHVLSDITVHSNEHDYCFENKPVMTANIAEE